MAERKLQSGLQFDIHIVKSKYGEEFYPEFVNNYGRKIEKLTPTQRKKAIKFLECKLRNFIGYMYTVKPEYQKEQIIKIK